MHSQWCSCRAHLQVVGEPGLEGGAPRAARAEGVVW